MKTNIRIWTDSDLFDISGTQKSGTLTTRQLQTITHIYQMTITGKYDTILPTNLSQFDINWIHENLKTGPQIYLNYFEDHILHNYIPTQYDLGLTDREIMINGEILDLNTIGDEGYLNG